jgi:adenylate kinase
VTVADPLDADGRVVVTGTPGTGKTTAVDRVETDLSVVHLNEWVAERDLYTGHDDDRDTRIVDVEAVREAFADRTGYLVESHLAHHLPADRVVVLRCHPATLRARLRERGESAATAAENAESEALDVVLAEAVERHGRASVYEIVTTDATPAAVADAVGAVVAGERAPSSGTVSYVDYLA